MANPLFRFAIVHPPQRVPSENIVLRTVRTHPPELPETALLLNLRRFHKAGDRAAMRQSSREYVDRHNTTSNPAGPAIFVVSLNALRTPIAELDQWLLRNESLVTFENLVNLAEQVLNTSISDAVKTEQFLSDRTRVGDSLLAVNLAAEIPAQPVPHLMRAIRIFGLLEHISTNPGVMKKPGTMRAALRASVLLPGDLYPLPSVDSPSTERKLEAHRKRNERYKAGEARALKLAQRLKQLKTAVEDLLTAYKEDRRILLIKQTQEPAVPGIAAGPGPISRHPERATVEIAAMAALPFGANRPFLSDNARSKLTEGTQNILAELGTAEDSLDVSTVVAAVESEIATVARELYVTGRASNVALIGNSFVIINRPANTDLVLGDLSNSFPGPCPAPDSESPEASGNPVPKEPPVHFNADESVFVADLEVVEQELQRYELSEIAHLENVMIGETKDRTHTRTRTTEETTFVETEVTEETERDLESTDRFELQDESEKVVDEDTSLEAGVTTSGSYGWVNFTAHASYARETATEDSQRTATTHSRDVTERAVSRIQRRVLEQRTRRIVEKFEETNLHKFENKSGPQHIAGIYRWVDKIYKAQVVNYGRRAMFEFVVPQPAAFLKHALSAQPTALVELEKPDPPGYCFPDSGKFVPLRPEDLLEENYMIWVGKYNVTSVDPPPSHLTVVAAAVSAGSPAKGLSTKSDVNVQVPPGYVAQRAFLKGTRFGNQESNNVDFFVFVGRHNASNFNFPVTLDGEDNLVPVVILTQDVGAYGFTLEVECLRTSGIFAAWQQATFNAIMKAYGILQKEYEDKVNNVEFQQDVAIQGSNPRANRETLQAELKRGVVSILTEQHFDLFDALRKNVPNFGYPELDFEETAEEGPYIRFFEQAFEWENMTYLFYPYFWGRKEDWVTNALLKDTDPLFTQFLRAGAARVVIPARPGFEMAVCSYLNNGWPVPDEADPTCIDEDSGPPHPFLSIIDEIKAQQGYDATPGEGTLTVVQGSSKVLGTNTEFDVDRDTDREIHIVGVKYRIAIVNSATEIILTTDYQAPSALNLRYTLGVRFVGEPWEVRVPTSLVMLQEDSILPSFS